MTSDLSFDWELVNRLPKIQTEAEFSELMSEHFVGFPKRNIIIETVNKIINKQGKSVMLDFFTNCSD